MENGEVISRVERGVATLEFNRPKKKNSVTPVMLVELVEALEKFKEDGNIRCVILRGTGTTSFSSGFDVSKIITSAEERAEMAKRVKAHPLYAAIDSITSFPYPIIAMIYGHCMGGSCEIATSCDFRVAADNLRIGMPPAKLGLLYSHTGMQRFINVVGLAYAKEMFYTGRVYGAEDALKMGLVNHVWPADELEEKAYEIAREIAGNAPLSVSGTKKAMGLLMSYQKISRDDENEIMRMAAICFGSEDLKEGRNAFLEKRKPNFKGK